nr:hypothetical protein [Tanacetum cinerariifolium]
TAAETVEAPVDGSDEEDDDEAEVDGSDEDEESEASSDDEESDDEEDVAPVDPAFRQRVAEALKVSGM